MLIRTELYLAYFSMISQWVSVTIVVTSTTFFTTLFIVTVGFICITLQVRCFTVLHVIVHLTGVCSGKNRFDFECRTSSSQSWIPVSMNDCFMMLQDISLHTSETRCATISVRVYSLTPFKSHSSHGILEWFIQMTVQWLQQSAIPPGMNAKLMCSFLNAFFTSSCVCHRVVSSVSTYDGLKIDPGRVLFFVFVCFYFISS